MLEFIVKYWTETLFGMICGAFVFVFNRIKAQNKKQLAIENGVQALLRDRLIDRYNECMKKEELSILDRENLNHMFKEYKNLGGNGTIEQIVSDLLDLPTKYVE